MISRHLTLSLGILFSAVQPASICFSQEALRVDASELPRSPHVPAERAIGSIELKEGFRLELVAAEPDVADPVAMLFDENGRMFVAEMRGYSEHLEDRISRIRLLEDVDGDGHYERSTIYADGLGWPTALFYYNGGLMVGDTHDLLYLKDTDGDGVADQREVLLTGFGNVEAQQAARYNPVTALPDARLGSEAPRQNVQSLLNNLTWGLDNRIHGAGSRDGGLIRRPEADASTAVDARRRDFSFHPRTLEPRAESGGGQHGLSFDDWGAKFVTSNSRHLRAVMYEARYEGRNPFYSMPNPAEDIPDDGPAAEIYRRSPDEPWRIVRTRLRRIELGPERMEAGGRLSGYFSGATGTRVYSADLFPEEYQGNVFVAEIGSNLVHRKILYDAPDGVGYRARRPHDEQTFEFLASTDTWFRPVDFVMGPEGALYLIDMYREVVEHPWSLPDSIKQHLDLDSGNDRGRIYRIVPDDFRQPAKPARLGDVSVAELVNLLAHPNIWHRATASRLLYERRDLSAVPLLQRLAQNSPSPLGRMHALYALDGLEALQPDQVLRALDDKDPGVRRHAVRLSEQFLKTGHARVEGRLLDLAADPSPRVRYQLAFTLGETDRPERIEALATVIRQDVGSRWTQAAVLNSLAEGPAELFQNLVERPLPATDESRRFMHGLAAMIGWRNRPDELAAVAAHLEALGDPREAFALLSALGSGLDRAGGNIDALAPRLRLLSQLAEKVAVDSTEPEALRAEAVRVTGLVAGPRSADLILGLLSPDQPQPIQVAALKTAARFESPEVAQALLQRWDSLTPRLRSEALTALLSRESWTLALLNAAEKGTLRPAEISSTQMKFLSSHRDERIRAAAERVHALTQTSGRQEVVERYLSALSADPDPVRGRQVFQNACASCHRLAGEGIALGPDLETVKATGKENVLVHILDPNREVADSFKFYSVETRDGKSAFGMVANETSNSVTLRQPFGAETTLPRSDILRMTSMGQSIMPEGLEAGITQQQMADLLEYIVQAGN